MSETSDEQRLELLQQETYLIASRVRDQAKFLHNVIWVVFGIMALSAFSTTATGIAQAEDDATKVGIFALGLFGVVLLALLAIVVDLFANRSRLHGLQGQIDAVRFFDVLDDDEDD
jgi:hypothetical protein